MTRPNPFAFPAFTDCKAAALHYAAIGWTPVPLYPLAGRACTCRYKEKCPTPGKHPWVKWKAVEDASAYRTPDTIARWFAERRASGVGLLTEPSGLVIIDIDPRNGGNESWQRLVAEHGASSPALEVVSGGGGRHLYFAAGGSEYKSGSNVIPGHPGIDIKAVGGLIVAPPTMHESGNRYRWAS